MKAICIAAVGCLSLIVLSDMALAQQKKHTAGASIAGQTCTTGQTCSTNCDAVGWCSRMVCAANKWEKRLLSCVGSFCPPKC
ncbi:MAG: hypothetical protein AB7K04_12050 [Pseudorhodoplanes sp.]